MKKVLGLIMNRNFIISFAVVVVGLKFLSEYYDISEEYFSFPLAVKMIFLVIYIAAALNVLSFLVIALVTKSKAESWWENPDNPQKESKRGKLLQIYIQSLVMSFIVVVYGTIIYLALSGTWRTIFIIAGAVIIGSLIDSFRIHKRQQVR